MSITTEEALRAAQRGVTQDRAVHDKLMKLKRARDPLVRHIDTTTRRRGRRRVTGSRTAYVFDGSRWELTPRGQARISAPQER